MFRFNQIVLLFSILSNANDHAVLAWESITTLRVGIAGFYPTWKPLVVAAFVASLPAFHRKQTILVKVLNDWSIGVQVATTMIKSLMSFAKIKFQNLGARSSRLSLPLVVHFHVETYGNRKVGNFQIRQKTSLLTWTQRRRQYQATTMR